MSKSPQAKANQNARFQHRVRRDKAAALLLPWFLTWHTEITKNNPEDVLRQAVADSVAAADVLLAELDLTREAP